MSYLRSELRTPLSPLFSAVGTASLYLAVRSAEYLSFSFGQISSALPPQFGHSNAYSRSERLHHPAEVEDSIQTGAKVSCVVQ